MFGIISTIISIILCFQQLKLKSAGEDSINLLELIKHSVVIFTKV